MKWVKKKMEGGFEKVAEGVKRKRHGLDDLAVWRWAGSGPVWGVFTPLSGEDVDDAQRGRWRAKLWQNPVQFSLQLLASGGGQEGRDRWIERDGRGEVNTHNLEPLLSSRICCLSLPPAAPRHQNKHFLSKRIYNHEWEINTSVEVTG